VCLLCLISRESGRAEGSLFLFSLIFCSNLRGDAALVAGCYLQPFIQQRFIHRSRGNEADTQPFLGQGVGNRAQGVKFDTFITDF
jgi:hypothetical protein